MEHSIIWQPWCKCITVHEQMRDQGSVCKLWCMVVLNAPLAFSLLLLLPSRGNCLSFLFINQKKKVDPGCFFPSFFSAFLSHRGTCDERALLMWSCRDPFHCQQHRFLCRTLSYEFACFRCCLCVLLCVHALPWLCMWKYFLIQVGPYFCVFRCMSCVSSQWGCQWNTQDHTCSDADNSVVVSHIIKHRQVSSF